MSPPILTIACQSANILLHLSAISSNDNLLTIEVFACASKKVKGVKGIMKMSFATRSQLLVTINRQVQIQ
jgi:hypothetical protein